MADDTRREIILLRVVERLDQRINRLTAVRNRIQGLAESLSARPTKIGDHETDPTQDIGQ